MTESDTRIETPITMAELKDALAKVKKRDEELNFRAEKTEEYLNQFKMLSAKSAKVLIKKITDLDVPRMKPEYIAKLVDILPTTPEEVHLVLQGYTITVTKENMKRVADVIKEHTK